jgi:hypothetical protein
MDWLDLISSEHVLGLAALVITPVVTWVSVYIQRRTGLEIEQKHRDALQTALANAAALLWQKLRAKSNKASPTAAEIADSVRYVRQGAGDALEHFEMAENTPKIQEMILAQLGKMAAGVAVPAATRIAADAVNALTKKRK